MPLLHCLKDPSLGGCCNHRKCAHSLRTTFKLCHCESSNVAMSVQASLATIQNLWIAVLIGALLTAFLWFNAPLLIQGVACTAEYHAAALQCFCSL